MELDASGVTKGVATGKRAMMDLSQAATLVGGAMRNLGAGMTLMMTVPIVGFFKSSVDAAMEQENAMAELNAVIESTGGIAGVTADELNTMATALQKVTKFDGDAIISGQSMLLTFTRIGREVFPQATETMLNLAEKFGGIQQASIMLGKALNDPIAGVTALRRVGIQLSDQQEQQIKNFMAVGDIMSAQKVILGELETQFGGLARAAGDTTAGKLIQLKNAFGDLQEVAGKAFIPHLLKLVEFLTKLIDKFMALPPWMQNAVFMMMLLVAALGPVIGMLGQLILLINGLVALAPAISSFAAGIGTLVPALSGIVSSASAAGTALAGVGGTALLVLGQILLLAAGPAILYLAFKNNFMGITDTAKQLWFIIKHYFTLMVNWIVDSFRKVKWSDLGKNMLFGIANGMLAGIPSMVAAAIKAAGDTLKAFDSKFKFGSPSKVMEQRGMWSAMGYIRGWENSMNPNAVASQLAKPVLNSANSQQNNITMQFAGGLTFREANALIDERMDQMLSKMTTMLAAG